MNFFKSLFKKESKGLISQTVILAMIFGFSAGMVGQIFSDVYINPWQQDFGIFSLDDIQNTSQIVPELKKIKKFLGIQQDFEVNNSVVKVYPTLVGVYHKKTAGADGLKKVYLTNEMISTGSILTSDGWIFTAGSQLQSLKKEQLSVVYSNKSYDVAKFIVDSQTGIVLLKINATNLPVISMGDSDEVTAGLLALTLNFSGDTLVSNVKNGEYISRTKETDLVLSSDKDTKQIQLADTFKPAFVGSPLVNLAGEVVGVVSDSGKDANVLTAVPINNFRNVVVEVLRSGSVVRPYLGVSYVDLAYAWGIDAGLAQNQSQGALVWAAPKATSPAALAGIKLKDIIISVDGQLVDKNTSLSDLVKMYKPDSEIDLAIMRDGKTQNLKVKLGTLEK